MARLYNGALIAPGAGMDSFNLMRAFRRIVERGGLARAAEDLGMSPAGLSKQLRTLEAHLGVVLLQRTTRRMSLTETGHAYYRECCRLLDELDALERGIAEQRGDVAGRLRVNAPQSFALSTLSPLLPRFLQQHPQLSLDLVMEDRLLDAVGEGSMCRCGCVPSWMIHAWWRAGWRRCSRCCARPRPTCGSIRHRRRWTICRRTACWPTACPTHRAAGRCSAPMAR